ncbi:MAG: ATP-binding protein [Bacteroidales bacterium]|nr:ATP-binding protein [Bacteroidales bacterium]
MDNPFIFRAYQTKELFCDRQEELKMLVTNTLSGADTALIAQRRIGKTGLVYRLIDEIRSESLPVLPIYVDIFATRLLEDFVKTLSSAIMNAIPEKSSIGKKFAKFIRSLRPLITYDPLTSAPQIQLTLQSEEEKKQTLTGLLTFLDRQEKKVLLAIDEFQQIREYPENDVEAMLRTIIQTLNNVTFLYCGSKRHIMLDIFGSERNPFYRSTAFVTLQKLDREVYAEFITKHFHEGGFGIDDTAVGYILDWTRGHTYFTQRLCHTVYDMARGRVDVALVKQAAVQILQSDAVVFGQYQQLLTAGQWNFLIAVAKEGEASQITSRQFLRRYHLGNPSSVSRIVPSLVEKNLLDENVTEGKTIYGLNDVFLSRWLEKKY